MGYVATVAILFVSIFAIITLYELAPNRVKHNIDEFIDHLGGKRNETRNTTRLFYKNR